jgi:hypothetical protein
VAALSGPRSAVHIGVCAGMLRKRDQQLSVLTEKQRFQWIKRLLSAAPTEQDAVRPNNSHEMDYVALVPKSLRIYLERRKQEISENYQTWGRCRHTEFNPQ